MREARADMARMLTEKARLVLFFDIGDAFDHITAAAIKGDTSVCFPVRQRDEERIIKRLLDCGFNVRQQRFVERQYGEDGSILYVDWRMKA